MASAQHQPVPLIAKLMQVSESYVRQVIHDFNEKGFEALDPKWSGGRPAKTDQATRDRICQIARCCPRDLGWPFSTSSLSKLADVLRINEIADTSRDTLRQILKASGTGRGWFGKRRPARLRATYHRTQGVRHMFGALDLATGQLYYRIRDRKRWTEFLAFLESLPARWPGETLYRSWTTTRSTSGAKCENGAPPTRWNWCSCQPIRRG